MDPKAKPTTNFTRKKAGLHYEEKKKDRGWEDVSHWYVDCVNHKGHFYHQNLIFPHLLEILKKDMQEERSILDMGCGEGVLSRQLESSWAYLGVDASKALLASAQKLCPKRRFQDADLSKPIDKQWEKLSCTFTDAIFLLSLQNIPDTLNALKRAHMALVPKGNLHIVLNHPCFRIPRQTHWGYDEKQKTQYRRVDRYGKSMKIPIQAHPSQGTKGPQSHSYHFSLESLWSYLKESHFLTSDLREWYSPKKSSGSRAKAENRAREEIPLFLYLQATKSAD